MTKKEIELLLAYDKWADLKILEACGSLSAEQYKKDLGASFNGVLGTLIHILSANKVWLDRWRGKEPQPLKAEDFPAIETVKKQWDQYHFEIENYLQPLTDEKILEELKYRDFKGNIYEQPLSQQIQHKVNHSSYHRGQIIMMLRQLEKGVVSTDMINYIRSRDK
jgi:uncharacterized damage-inducible protein DinB